MSMRQFTTRRSPTTSDRLLDDCSVAAHWRFGHQTAFTSLTEDYSVEESASSGCEDVNPLLLKPKSLKYIAKLSNRKIISMQRCVTKKPRTKRKVPDTDLANQPPPPTCAACTPTHARVTPTPIVSMRWQRGPQRWMTPALSDLDSM